MERKRELDELISRLRKELEEMLEARAGVDEEVVRKSQELDTFLFEYQLLIGRRGKRGRDD